MRAEAVGLMGMGLMGLKGCHSMRLDEKNRLESRVSYAKFQLDW